MAGQWVCIEEWREVDLLALSAWSDAAVIGYEVKVSRSDLRQELLRPRKRTEAVAMCTEFYFAVPKGLLKADELAYEEPEWSPTTSSACAVPASTPSARPTHTPRVGTAPPISSTVHRGATAALAVGVGARAATRPDSARKARSACRCRFQ
jgi:hypothetical protein